MLMSPNVSATGETAAVSPLPSTSPSVLVEVIVHPVHDTGSRSSVSTASVGTAYSTPTSLPPPPAGHLSAPSAALARAERGRLLSFLVLEFSLGLVEVFCYNYLGSIFCAFMSGTLVLLGLHLTHASDETSSIAPALVSLGSFCAGSWLAGRARDAIPASALIRRCQSLLALDLLFLIAATTVASRGSLDDDAVRYPTITLTAIALAFQMAAQIALSVTGLATPLATTVTHTLFAENPFKRGNGWKSLRRLSQIVALLAGAITGSATTYDSNPWTAEIIGCGFVVAVIIALEIGHRQP